MFNFTIVRNGRLDDCWMQWKLPSRSSPLAPRCPIDIHQPTPQTQSDHPGCVRRWNVSEPSVFLSCFFGGWVFVSFLFVQFEPCRKWSFLAWVILVMQWKQMDIASVASIARTIWIRDPECFILFCFSVYFSVGRFFMAFWCCCFPMSFPYYRFEHIHWTFRRSSPGTLGRDSLPASASNGEEALSIPVSGCEKLREKRFCISQQGAEQNRDMNCWCWKPYKNRKVLMEKILWAPVHRVQILMHELPTLLYSNHKCLTIGFNVQVMSALMPIVLLKVRKPPKKQTDDGCKSLIRLKKTLWQVGEFVSFTLFVTESSPSIYLKKSPAEMMEREDAPESNSAISAWSQGTTSDSWGDLEPVRQPLKKKTASWKSHESAVKTPHDLDSAVVGWGFICSIGVWARWTLWNCRDPQITHDTQRFFWIFALWILFFPTGNRFGWQLDCSGCLFIYVIMTLEGIPDFQIRTKPWLSCVSLL